MTMLISFCVKPYCAIRARSKGNVTTFVMSNLLTLVTLSTIVNHHYCIVKHLLEIFSLTNVYNIDYNEGDNKEGMITYWIEEFT